MTEFKLASTKQRVVASIIDYSIFFIVAYLYIEVFGEDEYNEKGNLTKVVKNSSVLPLVTFWFFLFPLIEGMMNQTFSKKIMGIKVTSINSRHEFGFFNAFKRRVLDWLEILPFGFIALFVSGNSLLKQRIGDIITKTVVVKAD